MRGLSGEPSEFVIFTVSPGAWREDGVSMDVTGSSVASCWVSVKLAKLSRRITKIIVAAAATSNMPATILMITAVPVGLTLSFGIITSTAMEVVIVAFPIICGNI